MRYLFQFRRYRLPFRAAVRTAHGIWAEREGVIVRLETEAGAVGYGEAAVIPWFGTETADEAEAACRELGNKVDDERLTSVPERLVCLRNALAAANPAEPSADTVPAHKHLGVAALLPAGRAALPEIAPKAEAGFRVFKWKVGVGDVGDELVLLDDVCAALPSGAKLRLDANGAWDRRQAERWLERCAERPVEFVEQPIAADARGAADILLGLAGDYPTPVALDESLVSGGDVERWIGAGWAGVFVVKPSLFADAPGTLARLAAAKADVVFSSALETVVGARGALRMAFAWKLGVRALGFGVWPLFADARFDAPFVMPFVRWEDVERLNPEAVWNALN
ncbi:MAG TPA: o-succinylbenzoate synthase [Opitutaceae bacterium]|nr:o-succinylbenzoate synthase [Opitutaceae bacterium]